MQQHTLKITIAGTPKAGTTTVAQLIQKVLDQVGIEATVEDKVGLLVSDEIAAQRAEDMEASFQDRLKSLVGRDDFKVEIETAPLSRIAL